VLPRPADDAQVTVSTALHVDPPDAGKVTVTDAEFEPVFAAETVADDVVAFGATVTAPEPALLPVEVQPMDSVAPL
jgi:hypothetical protein